MNGVPADDPFLVGVIVAAATFLGACFGSFLNVVIWRTPRGQSVISPPSACPACGRTLRTWENVPVLAWLALRGRCARCRAPISRRYPLVEAGIAVLWAALAWRLGPGAVPVAIGAAALGTGAVAAAAIEHDGFPVPPMVPVWTVGLAVPACIVGALLDRSLRPVLGALALGSLLGLVYLLASAAMPRRRFAAVAVVTIVLTLVGAGVW